MESRIGAARRCFWAAALFAVASAAAAVEPPVEAPRGIYSSSGALDAAVINHPQAQGVLIRVAWSDLEPSPGSFTMTPIRNQLRLVRQTGAQWSLAVLGGPKAPTWLYGSPYFVSPLQITFRNQPVTVPKFWDATLQTRLALLAEALADEFADDPQLRLVYLPQMSANGIEGHFNGNPDLLLMRQGFSEDLWVESVVSAAGAFAAAFPDKPIAVELHDILGSANAGTRILQAIDGDPVLQRQVGVALWWLSGRSDYQGALLNAIAAFGGAKYAQVIDQSANSAAFPNGGYASVYKQARSLGIRYVEPWAQDLKSGQWDALFADFNSWAQPN